MKITTRFAPSPTGLLHIGGARTALFNYVYAKSKNGDFRVRIEDTDHNRKNSESYQSIIEGLKWLGIKSDKEIVFQKNNIERHILISKLLVKEKLAYKCFHTEKEVLKIKENKKKFRSIWRNKYPSEYPANKDFVVRMKIPNNKQIQINDLIQGKVNVNSNEIDDYIILRSNGSPTFLLSSAVDDFDMNISHIIRGDDHLTNTFRQIFIFDYLYEKLPKFAHIPLIHNEQGKKLSKRDNVKSIIDLKKEGFINKAIINYLLRLGWAHKNLEVFSIEQAINLFKIKNVGKSPAKINEKKMLNLNSYYLKNLSREDILQLLITIFNEKEIKINSYQKDVMLNLINTFKGRSKNINDLYNSLKFIFHNDIEIAKNDNEILLNSKNYKNGVINELSSIKNWTSDEIQNIIKKFIDNNGINFKCIGQPLRLILTKDLNSPSISIIMEALGKEQVMKKIIDLW